jgi:hypothetical protein
LAVAAQYEDHHMTKSKLALVAAVLALSLSALAAPVSAASAHNDQYGTHSSNHYAGQNQ